MNSPHPDGSGCGRAGSPAADADAPAEVHIAGVLIQVLPAHVDDIVTAVSLLPGAEVTHAMADGRIVAVLEGSHARAVVQQMDSIRALKGVANVALVYQHAESEDEMRKELPA
jgi:nitrate reductase NapD